MSILLASVKSIKADGLSSDKGPMLEMSALKLFTMDNLRYQLSW